MNFKVQKKKDDKKASTQYSIQSINDKNSTILDNSITSMQRVLGNKALFQLMMTSGLKQAKHSKDEANQLLMNNKQSVNKDRSSNESEVENLIQRKVPDGSRQNGDPKETPETARYNPHHDDTPYERGTNRSVFSFGLHTRPVVLDQAGVGRHRISDDVVSVFAEGQAVPVHAVSLDHNPISWNEISQNMADYNEQSNPIDPYTRYDAKLYYNDITNLIPVLSGINSAYGDGDRPHQSFVSPILKEEMLSTHTEWTDLQHTINAASIDDEEQAILFGERLHEIKNQMERLKRDIQGFMGLT